MIEDRQFSLKLSYENMFIAPKGDTMVIIRIIGKQNNNFNHLKSYLQEIKSSLSGNPIRERNIVEWLLTTQPKAIISKDLGDGKKLDTIIYPYCDFSTLYGCSLYHLPARVDSTLQSNYIEIREESAESILICQSEILKKISVEITAYSTTLVQNNKFLLFPANSNNREFMERVTEDLKIYNDLIKKIGIKLICNPKKEYTRNSVVKCNYRIYDTLEEAINNHIEGGYALQTVGGQQYPVLLGEHVLNCSNKRVYRSFSNKIKCKTIDNRLVLYDGNKGLSCFEDKISRWQQNIKLICILQYNGLRLPRELELAPSIKTAIIRFLSPTCYDFSNSNNYGEVVQRNRFGQGGRLRANGRAWFKNKTYCIQINFNNSGRNNYGPCCDAIIPFGDKTHDAIDALNDVLVTNNIDDIAEAYLGVILRSNLEVNNEEDILTNWFAYCVRTKQHNDDKLLKAYKRMKGDLIRERKALQDYISNYDFSKVIPVPTIELDKKAKENYYKSLHIQPKTIIINSVNNKKIKEIVKTQAMVDFMIIKGESIIAKSNTPLVKYYNPTRNVLEFGFNKMKGEMLHDKTKNRF